MSGSLSVAIEIPVADSKNALGNLQVEEGGTAFLFGPDSSVISANQQKTVSYKNIYKQIQTSEDILGQFLYTQDKQTCQIIYRHLENTGLVLGMYFPESQLMKRTAGSRQ